MCFLSTLSSISYLNFKIPWGIFPLVFHQSFVIFQIWSCMCCGNSTCKSKMHIRMQCAFYHHLLYVSFNCSSNSSGKAGRKWDFVHSGRKQLLYLKMDTIRNFVSIFQPYAWCMECELFHFSAIGIETLQQNPSASELWPKSHSHHCLHSFVSHSSLQSFMYGEGRDLAQAELIGSSLTNCTSRIQEWYYLA